MKVTVSILFAVFGLAAAAPASLWDMAPDSGNSTQCVYSFEKNALSCRGDASEVVECPTEGKFGGLAKELRVFGLSRVEGLEKANPEDVRYWFYPRKLDNFTYFNHSVLVDGAFRDLVLYYSEKFGELGIRVTDMKCYQKLVRLFNGITVNKMGQIEGGNTASLFGEVLMLDRDMTKRWLPGFGWGFGLGPFAWPAFGWGLLPFLG